MNASPLPRSIERIVVRLDAASDSRTAIDTAARLAAHAGAPLHGEFVEDEELLHLAALPFARQVTLGAGAERFTVADAELHLRAAAERARKDLLAVAQRHHVTASFAVVRGGSASAQPAASDRDLVVTGAHTRPIAGHFRVERRWWSSIEVAGGPFLLARQAWAGSGSVVMLLSDCGPSSARLLEATAQLAQATGSGVTVISPPAVAGVKDFDKWVGDRLAGFAVRLQIEIAPAEAAALHRRIGELDCRLLAIEAGLVEGRADRLRELVERFACDVLIVR